MKTTLTIIACKLLRALGKLVGRGSSLPGQIALKICPDILKRVTLPKTVIAVTGSNGKTSSVEMIAKVLLSAGKRVAYNKEGSNQIEGVTSLILCDCDLRGRAKSEILLIESDERYARYTFSYFSPTHYVITNLYRDQLTRNGHPEWVAEAIRPSIPEGCTLILNADDPTVSSFGKDRDGVVYFGMDRQSFSTDENTGVYDDGAYCPICNGRLEYSYRHYNHIGEYFCPECQYKKHACDYRITHADLDEGYLVINEKSRIDLAFRSIYNAYNILSCYAVCDLLGIDEKIIEESIGNYVLKNGRVVGFTLGGAQGTLLTSKHENSVSYDQSLRYIVQQGKDCGVVVIVDAISRKYFTSETSWLFDIDFGMLNNPCVKKVYLSGKYANDLAIRFSYTELPQERIVIESDIGSLFERIKEGEEKQLYVVTCFSDKDKFLSGAEYLEMRRA